MTVKSADFNNVAKAISAYTQAERADANLLVSTALVGSDARITDAGENYTGTLRFLDFTDPSSDHKQNETLGNENINLMGLTNSADVYIKNIDHVAAQEMSIQKLISKVDGLAYLGAQFASVRARKEDAQLQSVLTGVVKAIWNNKTTSGNVSAGLVNNFGYYTGSVSGTPNALFTNATGVAQARSTFFDTLFDALSAIKGEFEEPFYYLVISSATMNTLRKENTLDNAPVVDGNFSFNTILGGKIRLVINNSVADAATGIKVSVLAKAGAFHYSEIAQMNPTAIERNELAGNGGGAVTILSRWGNIMHPKGCSWSGTATAYPSNSVLANKNNWDITATNVNQIGLFPIFHG